MSAQTSPHRSISATALALRLLIVIFLSTMVCLKAQSPGTGSITGRVFNPATGEYVKNAEVHVEGTGLSAFTEDDGSFLIAHVPAGKVTVSVSYTGYTAAPATVTVDDFQAANHDFILKSTDTSAKESADGIIKLDAYSVSAEREGNAKAIMEQKRAMNMSNIVAAETFGNIAEGNVGDFVKYLPGIQLDYVEADARSPRIRGLPAQYTSVTFNGMKLASADGFTANGSTDNGGASGSGGRSFGFEQVSMNSVDAVAVNFTTDASP